MVIKADMKGGRGGGGAKGMGRDEGGVRGNNKGMRVE